MSSVVYPFAAIVGQKKVKRGLFMTVVNPAVGGALLCGQKGTAKSTAVRALAELTNKRVVELPLNVTEDMLIGAVDFEHAIKTGERRFAGGILQRADGQILYVDEINLLPESITSALIACANGENYVEREGISFKHDCRFTLVGTMNPEEGLLRPQLLDKLGLYLEVTGEAEEEIRAEIVRRRLDFESDPPNFIRRYETETKALSARMQDACKRLPQIEVSRAILQLACGYAARANAQGNRCEIFLIEAAKAIAALDGREVVSAADINEAAEYVLPHRKQEVSEMPQPRRSEQKDDNKDDNHETDAPNPEDSPPGSPEEREQVQEPEGEGATPDDGNADRADADRENAARDDLAHAQNVYETTALPPFSMDRMFRKGSGRRTKTRSGTKRGRYAAFAAAPNPACQDVALDATIRAAAPYQRERSHDNCAISLEESDLRFKTRESHTGATIVFLVDASGSMGAAQRMKETKEAILSLLWDSYKKRDKVGLIAFGRGGARTLLEVTSSVDLAERELQSLPAGGKTPLAAGLFHAWRFIRARRVKDPEIMPVLLLVTDGRANEGLWTQSPMDDAIKAASLLESEKTATVVIDAEKSFVALGFAKKIARAMNAVYWKVDGIKSGQLSGVARTLSASLRNEVLERRRYW